MKCLLIATISIFNFLKGTTMINDFDANNLNQGLNQAFYCDTDDINPQINNQIFNHVPLFNNTSAPMNSSNLMPDNHLESPNFFDFCCCN